MSKDSKESNDNFGHWAVLELKGYTKVAGYVTEEEHFGTKMGRIDIPNGDDGMTTQYFGGSSIHRLTPTTEEVARAFAARSQPRPVHQYELALPEPYPENEENDDYEI